MYVYREIGTMLSIIGEIRQVPTCTAILGRVVYGMQRILYTLRGILTDEF